MKNDNLDFNPLPGSGTDEIVQSPGDVVDSENLSGVDAPTDDLFGSVVESQVESAISQWVGFDPAIHAANSDGTPKLRTNGSYALKRGRKSGGNSGPTGYSDPADTTSDAQEIPGSPTAVNAAASAMSNKQTAVFLVETITGILGRAIGPEWNAEKDEKKGLASATEQYLAAKGGLQISPEMGLVLALSAYAVPRLATENTQSKLSRFMGWCADRVAVVRNRLGV